MDLVPSMKSKSFGYKDRGAFHDMIATSKYECYMVSRMCRCMIEVGIRRESCRNLEKYNLSMINLLMEEYKYI
jgi:hypothetical protein